MPVKKIITREATYKYKHKNPNKVYKTGKRKGQRPTIIRNKARFRYELDIDKTIKELKRIKKKYAITNVVLEKPILKSFNTRSIIKTLVTRGILEGILYTLDYKVHMIHPSVWKKALNLSSEKSLSFDKAKTYTDYEFTSEDECEAYLIGIYFLEFLLNMESSS